MVERAAIEAYWEDPRTVSLLDENLRALEEALVLRHLDRHTSFADFGCGGGDSTVRYAARVKNCLALEQSNHLRSLAARRIADAGVTNTRLEAGSVTDLTAFSEQFDVALTQRVVINFATWQEQKQVIDNVRSTLRPGGLYIMLENTYEGLENLNAMRRSLNLTAVPLHWHNNFLHHKIFLEYLQGKFVVEEIVTFDLYYFLTRVFMNMFAQFEGYGADAKYDAIFKQGDAAARKLYEAYGDKVHIEIDRGSSFGPIQGFVLRKVA
jgi:cyclopropane fatty-acyl-phospholipid synthase-like methyltransferase